MGRMGGRCALRDSEMMQMLHRQGKPLLIRVALHAHPAHGSRGRATFETRLDHRTLTQASWLETTELQNTER